MENVNDQPAPLPADNPPIPPQLDGQQIATAEHPPEAEKKDGPKWTDIIIAAFTVALVIVSIIQAVIFKKQWEEMHSGGADTHELAVAAKKQADAAKSQADEAKAQVDLLTQSLGEATTQANATKTLAENSKATLKATEDSTQLEERAWIGVQTVVISHYEVGKPIELAITIKNTGRSPALKLRTSTGHWAFEDFGKSPYFPYDFELTDFENATPMPPEGVFDIAISTGKRVLSEGEKDNIGKQKTVFWVWGVIRYEDIFHTPHATRFCAYTRNDASKQPIQQGAFLKNCPEYSDMD